LRSSSAIADVAGTVARMREFFQPRETQLTLSDVNGNRMIEQVIELTRARWCDVQQQRGAVIELRKELDLELPEIMGAEVEICDALTNLISQCGRRNSIRRYVDVAHRRRACGVRSALDSRRSERDQHQHGRRDATPLPRAVLHDEGRTRHGTELSHGVRLLVTSIAPRRLRVLLIDDDPLII
jgi:hypothetical protein